ncbi:Predicted Zn-dependent peptidase [Alkalithermobacter thermoalcaliphilus JW-YL-7 = DSM 7308]|uniref:Peptidase M16 domain protein n=1 Tax=Alkalithermobacter thermoalcaliphilus JW-YL-7 = DSM 7308 TaxID=1121328 RepID=A0A150FR70_CLOPD|nr:peptidase M16 domain protein [[Clostridium] paradoxum JW-YL-7 = DSM 7308]SHK98857.1 Predicted Zn-dependent peptidase [[Clostridium] paradoxum JW-YL-7 = DSM 7308]
MKEIVNDKLKESIFYEKLENGLELFFMHKPGFTKKYAVFATKYGSNDLEFIPANKDKKIRVNEGIAHFLEHKMFEQPDGKNAFDKFSDFGASANAYTNFTMTAYLFSCTENFYPCLEHLLDYVQTPYFTDENVEKEKGIIEQEINMYNDNADWKVYFNALKAMYVNHPTRIDIAGTVESIYKITKEELYDCYNTFYSPGNMALFVVGDLEKDKVISTVRQNMRKEFNNLNSSIKRFYPDEPKNINQKEIVENLSVSIPMFNIGFKDTDVNYDGDKLLNKEIATEIILDMIFDKGSILYEQLYLKGLINESFGCDYVGHIDHGYTIMGGESKDPKKVKDIIFEYIQKYRKEGLDEESFNRSKRKKIGKFLKSFDSIEFIANNFISYHFKGINITDYLEAVKNIKFEDVINRFNNHFTEENCVISIINPK